MASVKKTVKMSKAKQAKKVSSSKAKAAKHSAAEPKTKRKASARALGGRLHGGTKLSRGAKSTARASAASRPGSPGSAKQTERKKISAVRAAERAAVRSVKKEVAQGVKTANPKRGSRHDAASKTVSSRQPKGIATRIRSRAKQQSAEALRAPSGERPRRVAAKVAVVAAKAARAPDQAPQKTAEIKAAASKATAVAILSLKRKSSAQATDAGQRNPASGNPPSGLNRPSSGRMALSSQSARGGSARLESSAAGRSAAPAKPSDNLTRIAAQDQVKGAGEAGDPSLHIMSKQSKNEPEPNGTALASGAARPVKPIFPGRPAVPAPKPAKSASMPRPPFKLGEFVVYPAHGVGQIVAIEEQSVAGFTLELFVLSFAKDKMILKVPVTKAVGVGMRKLADAEGAKTALDILAGRARIKRTMWSRRAQEYEAKINSGDLNAIAEVVRDLYRSDTQPEQSYSERQLYEAALDRMAREIVAVLKLTETEALKTIEAHLRRGPKRGKAEDAEADDADIEEAA
jgi:CarD family transcriptional regulator